MFRFIHSADLHLGRRFANLAEPPDGTLRGRLREARHQAIPRLAAAARIAGAAHILLAGDTFDTATPSPGVLRHALQAMAAEAPQTWWLLPGNHDNLAEGEALWDRIEADAPPNVRVLRDGAPRALEAGAMLLPAPVERRAMGYDPTASLGAVATPPGTLRIGLAHGGVTDFDGSAGHIPPDRAKRAALDYLALGDWHGRRAIGPRTQYSGSPEQDRFRHGRRGVCLSVALPGVGAAPEVVEIETGAFLWQDLDIALRPETDPAAALTHALPRERRRETLLRVRPVGWMRLAASIELSAALAAEAPDFAYFEPRMDAIATEVEAGDLDAIDRAGALRHAAAQLHEEAADQSRAAADRAVAAAALRRLYAYVQEADG